MITNHGQERVMQRFGVAAENAEAIFRQLWRGSHAAKPADFEKFGAARLPDKIYRVSGNGQWLLVKSSTTGRYVTIIPRR